MSTACSGNCPGCKKRKAGETRSASLIQIAAEKLKGSSETPITHEEDIARGLMVADILAHASSFVL